MAIIQISKIQVRTGNIVDLPQLDEAEFGWATDVKRLYIGKVSPAENIEVLTSYSNINFSQLNGANGNLDIANTTLENGQVLSYDGNNWVNKGGNANGLINLGDVGNVKISGGALSYVLQTDGTGNLSWTPKSTIIAFIENVTQADPGVITTTANNYFVNGSEITITDVVGMTELNGLTFYANVITSNTFSLYSDPALTTTVDTTLYGTFPNTTATATNTNNRITVASSQAFTIGTPIVFKGTTFGGITAGKTYYVLTTAPGPGYDYITISETPSGSVVLLTQATGTCTVYATGGRILSLVEGGSIGGYVGPGGTDGTVQFNNGNLLGGDSGLVYSYSSTPRILTLNGNANVGNLNATVAVTASTVVSNVATGTPPLSVSSTTRVSNLNVEYSNVSDFGVVTLQTTGTYYPTLVSTTATGNKALASNANLAFNVATGNLQTNILFANGNITGGNLISNGTITATGNIRANGLMSANGNISANGIISANGNITANGIISASGNILTNGLLSANGNISANGILRANGNVIGLNFVSQSNNGSDLNIVGATQNTAGVQGGNIIITSGSGNGSGSGGNLVVSAGAGGSSGAGGQIQVSAGAASGTDNSGGTITISSGVGTGAGAASQIIIKTPTVGTTGSTPQLSTNRVVINDTTVNVVTNTTSTSTSTGGLVVVGGVGIGGNLNVAGNISGNLIATTISVTSITATGNIETTGNLSVTGNIATSNSISVSGNILGSTNMSVLGNVIGNNLAISNIANVGVLNVSGKSNLNAIGNVYISGGSAGQVIQTDGSGNLSFTTVSTSSLSNGSSNIQVLSSANITLSSAGNANVVVVTGTGVNVAGTLSASGTLTSGNVTTSGNISAANISVTGKSNLNNISNITILGGSSGQVIQTDGLGNLSFGTVSTSSLANGNSNIQILNNGNINLSATGTSNVVQITSGGMNVTGYSNITGTISLGGGLTTTGNVNVGNLAISGKTNLNAIGNVFLSGGTIGQAIVTDGAGNLSFATLTYSNLSNGSSNIRILLNSNINFTSNNVTSLVLANTGANVNSLGVGTAPSGVAGEIRATNNITAYYSDERLKNKLGDIENALDKLCSLTGFYYEANELAQALGYTVKREVGLSAQDVEKVLPEVVVPAPIDEQYKTVHYERIIPLIVEAIKELRIKIDKLI